MDLLLNFHCSGGVYCYTLSSPSKRHAMGIFIVCRCLSKPPALLLDKENQLFSELYDLDASQQLSPRQEPRE
jgi:hypothetical protein